MAVGGRAFFDTSVPLAGLIEMGEPSIPADRILDGIVRGAVTNPLTAWHCCLEFYSVATRLPAGLRLEPDTARRLVEAEVLARSHICELPADARSMFLSSAASDRVAGGRVYDAHIGDIARLAGTRVVVTDNRRHFAALLRHDIRVWTAAEFAEECQL